MRRNGAAFGVAGEIYAERIRQRDFEGWTTEHDDHHDAGELARAAAAYALQAQEIEPLRELGRSRIWPWGRQDWKPKDPRRDLIRAAALLIAEVERLDRCSLSEQP